MQLHCKNISGFIILLLLFTTGKGYCQKEEAPCPKSDNKKADKIYDKAINEYKTGPFAKALQYSKEVIEADPSYIDAYYLSGLIYISEKYRNIKLAEQNFLKVAELCADYNNYIYFYLGKIYFGAEKWEDAVKNLKLFIKDVDKVKSDKDYNDASDMIRYADGFVKMMRNPVPFEPQVVRGVSSPTDEYLFIISPDNELALYTRVVRTPPRKGDLIQRETLQETFMVSKRTGTNEFTIGEPMPEPFNQRGNEGGATITADNKYLVYTVCEGSGTNSVCDLYYSELDEDGFWSDIKSVGKKINSAETWESQPSITSDGKGLYFTSDRPGGYGGYDLYYSVKDDIGEWGTAVNLGPKVNTKGNEKTPFIHTDSQTLYYASDGLPGMGGYDIFYTRKDSTGEWTKPKNIGYPINTPDDETGLFVSTDGNYAYFASNKYNGPGGWDLYSFPLYEEARPEKVLFVKGELKDESTKEPVMAKIEMKNLNTLKVTEIPVDSKTGKYVAVFPFKNDYIMTVKKEGFAYESKYIAKKDTAFEKPATVNIDVKPIEIGVSYKLNDIYFPTNSYDLSPESKTVIDGFIEFLSENTGIRVEIQGHTDDIGNDKSNQVLSENRAKSVYDYIILKGISSDRLTYKGYGEANPIASNLSEAGRAKNRRTVFVIMGK